LTLREHDIKGITFPPHTIQIFQAVNMSLFGLSKRKLHHQLPLENSGPTLTFIQKAFHSLKQIFVLNNVRNAFEMLELEFNPAKSPFTLLLREEKLRASQRFRENWDADSPMDQISKRHREARSDWINQDEQIS
jgi:hypothetical protein